MVNAKLMRGKNAFADSMVCFDLRFAFKMQVTCVHKIIFNSSNLIYKRAKNIGLCAVSDLLFCFYV